MNGFATDLFQILRAGLDDQLGGRDGRKTVGGAGPAQQTIKKGLFNFPIPFKAPLNDCPQKGQASAGNAGLMAGGSEDRTGYLTETATVALRNFVIVFGDVGTIHRKFF
jgi:hypothetical protein